MLTIKEAKERRGEAGLEFTNSLGTVMRTTGTKDKLGFLADVLGKDGEVLGQVHQGDWHHATVNTLLKRQKKNTKKETKVEVKAVEIDDDIERFLPEEIPPEDDVVTD